MSDIADYATFCQTKLTHRVPVGMPTPPDLPTALFPFQRDLVNIALKRGRCALFTNTGTGKSPMQLAWADAVAEYTAKPVLILTPLAVAAQMVADAETFGVMATRARGMSDIDGPGVYVTNYDRIHLFDASAFGGISLDEGSAIKSYTSSTRNMLTEQYAATPFRLSATATPAPNEFIELGTQAEFLGIRTREEMLAEFFVHDGGSTQDWRLKGHARDAFWRWVSTWALVMRKPSDLGYEDGGFNLPALHVHERTVTLGQDYARRSGSLFVEPAAGLSEQRQAKRLSIEDRVAAAAALVAAEPDEQWLIWGELNPECDAAAAAIPGAVQVAGSDSEEDKESRLIGFANGTVRRLVSKSSICGAGLNFQSCARMIFLAPTHSFEGYYQSIRRIWRFKQTREVHVYIIATDADGAVLENLRRKEREAQELNDEASIHMVALTREAIGATVNEREDYQPTMKMTLPKWLRKEAA